MSAYKINKMETQTVLIINGMMHDIFVMKCDKCVLDMDTMIKHTISYIISNQHLLIGKHRFIRILINKLIDIKSMAKNIELKSQVQSTIDTLFDIEENNTENFREF